MPEGEKSEVQNLSPGRDGEGFVTERAADGEEAPCTHLDQAQDVDPSANGCEDCLRIGGRWVHLRICMTCGHVGCCDNSPNRHATAHWHGTHHPLIRSFEPGEDWWWCYADQAFFEIPTSPPAPSYS